MDSKFKKFIPFLIIFLFYFVARISFFYIPIYLNLTGFSGFEIGLLVALSSVAAFISFFPSGIVNDRQSIKKPLAISFLLLGAFYFGITVFKSFAELFVLFLLGGIGLKVGTNSLRNFFLKSQTEKKGERFGKYQLFVMFGVGAGVLVFSLLVSSLHFSLVFQAIAIFLVILISFLFLMDDFESGSTKIQEYKNDFLRKEVIFFSAILFLFTMHWGAESTSYGLLLTKDFGLNLTEAGRYMAFSLVFFGVSAYFYGKKLDEKKATIPQLMSYGMIISGLMHVLMVFEPIWFSFIARVAHELGDGIFQVAMLFWISNSFEFRRIAGNASLIMTITVLGEITGALIFSTIGGLFGYGSAFISSGVLSILAALIFIIYKKNFFKNNSLN
ncbi:MAG: hypothetical protein COV47_03940 [Candidatus Diapherotrites archaeon CG11_big_fil_rev_8_21_14_0_20_37_9]|nr:MAG: hypothetical protein COV47_03940 [Candidatus Diapherotrites archaeon CG11_big_fil_rev_8_21_14_0_20_37_9]